MEPKPLFLVLRGTQPQGVVEGPAEMLLEINQATEYELTDHSQSDDGPTVQLRKLSVTSDSMKEKVERVAGDLSEMVKEKETLEAYIRQVVDPENSRGMMAMNLGSLIRWMIQEHERRMRELRRENNEPEDQIWDAKQAFEAIIIGQNLAVREIDHDRGLAREEVSELSSENWNLRESSTKAEEGMKSASRS